jgi:hypothetical protein
MGRKAKPRAWREWYVTEAGGDGIHKLCLLSDGMKKAKELLDDYLFQQRKQKEEDEKNGIVKIDGKYTGNILVHFDHSRFSIEALLSGLSTLQERLQADSLSTGEGSRNDGHDSVGQTIYPMNGLSSPVTRAFVQGALGHVVVDTILYGATASVVALGWTWVGHLGLLHLLLDVVVWGTALQPVVQELRQRTVDVPMEDAPSCSVVMA